MIHKGASKMSTAGYSQNIVCKRINYDVTIDVSKVEAINVQFGIGSVSSIGAFKLDMPVGTIEFHVVYADTPLLSSLADMDRLKMSYVISLASW